MVPFLKDFPLLKIFSESTGAGDPLTERLEKEIGNLKKAIKFSKQKLNNIEYLNKAPKNVVAKEEEKLITKQNSLAKLQQKLLEIT